LLKDAVPTYGKGATALYRQRVFSKTSIDYILLVKPCCFRTVDDHDAGYLRRKLVRGVPNPFRGVLNRPVK